jgi:hypothetical protein
LVCEDTNQGINILPQGLCPTNLLHQIPEVCVFTNLFTLPLILNFIHQIRSR